MSPLACQVIGVMICIPTKHVMISAERTGDYAVTHSSSETSRALHTLLMDKLIHMGGGALAPIKSVYGHGTQKLTVAQSSHIRIVMTIQIRYLPLT